MNTRIALLTLGLVITSSSVFAADLPANQLATTRLTFDQLQGVMAVTVPDDRLSVPGMDDPEMTD